MAISLDFGKPIAGKDLEGLLKEAGRQSQTKVTVNHQYRDKVTFNPTTLDQEYVGTHCEIEFSVMGGGNTCKADFEYTTKRDHTWIMLTDYIKPFITSDLKPFLDALGEQIKTYAGFKSRPETNVPADPPQFV